MQFVRMLVLSAVAVVTVALFAGTASADVATCQAKLDDLTTLVNQTSFTSSKDQVSLLRQLDSVRTELGKGKIADAIKKTRDFRVKVEQLVAGGKIGAADGQALLAGADDAIACLQELQAG
jgi:hypothetical protein